MDCQPNEEFCCCCSLRTGGIVICLFGIMLGVAGMVSIVIQPNVSATYWAFGIFLTITTSGMSKMSISFRMKFNSYPWFCLFSSDYCNFVCDLLIWRTQGKPTKTENCVHSNEKFVKNFTKINFNSLKKTRKKNGSCCRQSFGIFLVQHSKHVSWPPAFQSVSLCGWIQTTKKSS